MKTKLVLWGTKGVEETTEKVLLALELIPTTNKVLTWVFEGDAASEEFSKALMDQWRKGQAVAFPEGLEPQEMTLSSSVSLLPEGITTDKGELLARTQTEWIFIVLSTKLFQNYQVELEELQEKIDGLKTYSKDMWESMKGFWAKVQNQVNEQNLFREHTNTLRNRTNELFAQLKRMRSQEDAQFEAEASENYQKVLEKLEPLEQKIDGERPDYQKIFDQLKTLQNEFKSAKLTRNLRSKLWERIDSAFKIVKLKRSPDSSPENRLVRRMDGLKAAIEKMEKSIGRDERDLSAQMSKINSGDVSQLETQLREVRAKLIRERIDSKSKKLADMNKTMSELEERHTKNIARLEKEKQEAKKILAEKAKKEEEAQAKIEEAKVEEVKVEQEVAKEEKEEAPETESVLLKEENNEKD